jgi:recombination protein RecR
MLRYPDPLLKLIANLKKLPGIGNKSAERFAFHLLDWSDDKLDEMGDAIKKVKKNLNYCNACGALIEKSPCHFCDLSARNQETICIVATVKDVFLIEETREYRGLYHVLGGTLSPFHGKQPDLSTVEKLKKRVMNHAIHEVILAFDSTLEGDATALFLKKELAAMNVTLTRLAFGLPMGSALEYIDGGTLGRALSGRRSY